MSTLSIADQDVLDILDEVLELPAHKRLREAKVTIGVLMAHAKTDDNGDPVGPALKLHGYPALAVVKINSLRDRIEGKSDATITLDGDSWKEQSDSRQRAILDHELTHLDVQYADGGEVKTDDAGRPKLKMRLHDLQMGGFEEVIKRHGESAVEADQYADMHKRLTQLDLFSVG